MKILWHSNSPWAPTGYGQQTALFAPYLREQYDLALSGYYGLEAARLVWNGIPVFPGLGDNCGDMFLKQHAMRWFGGDPRGGMVVTLMDVWVMPPELGAQMNVVSWCPVDHQPAQSGVKSWFVGGPIPMAMSRFGEHELRDLDPLYCPHGVDTEVYFPRDRREVRKASGGRMPSDAFLVGMVAANKGRPSRKCFLEVLQAFAAFSAQHDDAYLYLHTIIDHRMSAGEDIPGLLDVLGIDESKVLIGDQYHMAFDPIPPAAMAEIYSAMDVLINPAMGEGFGIPILEAQACGVPVIVTNFSAMPEVGKVGVQVGYRPSWSRGQSSWQASPDVGELIDALRWMYSQSNSSRKELSRMARQHALTYDVRKVFEEHMLPSLKEAERRFEERQPVAFEVAA